MAEAVADSNPSVDGRSARSQRTRDAVVAALLALLREENLRPTAKEIAEKAGISLRSVYVHFDDVEDLFCAAALHEMRSVRDYVHELSANGPLPARLDAFVTQRVKIWEQMAPVRLAASLQEPFSPTLSTMLETARANSRNEISRVFDQELATLEPDQRESVVALCEIIASGETWHHLRRQLGFDIEGAAATMHRGVSAQLGAR